MLKIDRFPCFHHGDTEGTGEDRVFFYLLCVLCVSVVTFKERKSDQAARPISIGPLNGLLHLYAQPIDLVVFQGSLVSCDRETVSWEELGT